MGRRPAYTLIEVFVAVGVIGLLAAILVPAVLAARESARRIQCDSNLRQISLAMHAYLAREGTFPSAMSHMGGGRAFVFSPFSRILSELGSAPLANALNFQIPQSPFSPPSAENATAAAVSLDVYLCPSDGGPQRVGAGALNYRVNVGVGVNPIHPVARPDARGLFEMERWVRPAEVRDGLATTAMLSERLRGDGDPVRWDPSRDPWYAGFAYRPADPPDVAVGHCAAIPADVPPHCSTGGTSWYLNGFDYAWYNHASPPNARVPDCTNQDPVDGPRGSPATGVYAARSRHAGGVSVVTADGAVHRVAAGVALPVWRALATRAGAELMPPLD